MRKLVVSVHSTANNIVTGPPDGDETDFGQWAGSGITDSLDPFLAGLKGVDTVLLGRGTYQDLVRKWPNVKDWTDSPEVVHRIGDTINTARKYVVTGRHPLDAVSWGEYEPPTQLVGDDITEQVRALKEGDGGVMITFGSPVLVQSLVNAGLVDEFQLIIHPVIMREGRRLFEHLDVRTDLRLVEVVPLAGGAMVVTYATKPA